MKVGIFVIGARQGGTTAMANALADHSKLQLGARKGAHFFDSEAVYWPEPDYGLLEGLFDWSDGVGAPIDATPDTSFWPNALERLHHYNPAAKLIMLLRHPAHRAYSHWRAVRTRREETLSFRDAVSETGRERTSSPNGLRRFSYLERGYYASQLKRAQSLFSPEQVFVTRTDALWNDPAATLQAVEDFLGIPREVSLNAKRRYIAPLTAAPAPPLSADAQGRLTDLFAADIEETAALAQLDLSDWLDPVHKEPMRPAAWSPDTA